jgi:hypothetical protein
MKAGFIKVTADEWATFLANYAEATHGTEPCGAIMLHKTRSGEVVAAVVYGPDRLAKTTERHYFILER